MSGKWAHEVYINNKSLFAGYCRVSGCYHVGAFPWVHLPLLLLIFICLVASVENYVFTNVTNGLEKSLKGL